MVQAGLEPGRRLGLWNETGEQGRDFVRSTGVCFRPADPNEHCLEYDLTDMLLRQVLAHVKLWYDPRTNDPIRREVRIPASQVWGPEYVISESYHSFTLDQDISDHEFDWNWLAGRGKK
jgi:hypothetical protein